MKNGDYIRGMDDERLARFLFNWSINTVSSFFQYGGQYLKNAEELKDWMKNDEFVCTETYVNEAFTFGQDFRDRNKD